jgi:hypothetical protein
MHVHCSPTLHLHCLLASTFIMQRKSNYRNRLKC